MQKLFYEMLDNRLNDIISGLAKNNAEYAVAVHKNDWLSEQIEDIINGHTDMQISGGDRAALLDFVESFMKRSGLETTYAYRQGYADCIQLLQVMSGFRRAA